MQNKAEAVRKEWRLPFRNKYNGTRGHTYTKKKKHNIVYSVGCVWVRALCRKRETHIENGH